MKILAYIELSFVASAIYSQPGEPIDTITKLKQALDKFSHIDGLSEFHFVYGKESDSIAAVAKVQVDEVPGITNVINEIKKILQLKTLTTMIVQPQLYPGESPKNPDFY